MTFNADAALGPTGAGPEIAVNLVGGVFGRVLADRGQHPVQYDTQRIQIIIGQWVEEQLWTSATWLGAAFSIAALPAGLRRTIEPRASSSQNSRTTRPRLSIRVT